MQTPTTLRDWARSALERTAGRQPTCGAELHEGRLRGGPSRRCSRRAAVGWPGAPAPRFSATLCVALLGPKGRAPAERQVRWPDRARTLRVLQAFGTEALS